MNLFFPVFLTVSRLWPKWTKLSLIDWWLIFLNILRVTKGLRSASCYSSIWEKKLCPFVFHKFLNVSILPISRRSSLLVILKERVATGLPYGVAVFVWAVLAVRVPVARQSPLDASTCERSGVTPETTCFQMLRCVADAPDSHWNSVASHVRGGSFAHGSDVSHLCLSPSDSWQAEPPNWPNASTARERLCTFTGMSNLRTLYVIWWRRFFKKKKMPTVLFSQFMLA